MNHPAKINLGSGKDYREDYLNIDINDYWSPDIVADVSASSFKDGSRTYATSRYGEVVLKDGSFKEIIANDVLEHVADLVATMTNCLELLETGGVFNVLVPYDLSYGAWQDPTHIRAFNERSWLYYTDWFWYLGWTTHRFTVRSLEMALSPQGEEMRRLGQAPDIIVRTPRMVESMKVALEKMALTEQDKLTLDQYALKHKAARERFISA